MKKPVDATSWARPDVYIKNTITFQMSLLSSAGEEKTAGFVRLVSKSGSSAPLKKAHCNLYSDLNLSQF